jgi:hypothetical protein
MIILIEILLGTGVVGWVLAMLWYKVTHKAPIDKYIVLGLFKVFMGLAVAMIAFAFLYKYVLR